jgi:hypothetical protein
MSELDQWPPIGAVWDRVRASPVVAGWFARDLTPNADAIAADLIPFVFGIAELLDAHGVRAIVTEDDPR